jgi:ABC-type lipoprotein release transport system permease subunit
MKFSGGSAIEVDAANYGDARRPNASFEQVTGDYFGVTGQKLIEGRTPDVYLAVGGLIAVVAIAATFWPARRATRVDPIVALRAD